MASTAATVFPHSRHQNIQDTQIKTAGGTFYDIQIINLPESGWSLSRIIQYVSRVFQTPENRVALVHGGPTSESEGEDARLRGVRFPISALEQGGMEDTALAVPPNPSGSEDRAGQSEDRSGQPPDDCFVTPMSELDLRSTSATSAEIYTRGMMNATTAGLACWHPQPRKPWAGEKGIVPGDVGTFDLTHGFRKIFNIWEDQSFPVARSRLPSGETTHNGEFAAGHTIVSGLASKIELSEDGKSATWPKFEFRCLTEQGALLACTTPADLVELVNTGPLRNFLTDHAGIIYQHANSLWQLADEDSLYIVSGCIKSDSWALAAYKHLAQPPDNLLTLSRRNMDGNDPNQGPIYDWIQRGTAEARFGSNSAARESGVYNGKDQCLFLQGFKLALSRTFRTRLKGQPVPVGDGQHQGANLGASPNSSVYHAKPGCGSSGGTPLGFGSPNAEHCDSPQPAEFQVDNFPKSSGASTFHPCDRIAELLLKMTGADCALSHDDDWRKRSPMSPWNDDTYLNILVPRTIIVQNGVAFLLPQDECPSEQIVKQEASLEERGNDLVLDSVGDAAPATALITEPGAQKADNPSRPQQLFQGANNFAMRDSIIKVAGQDIKIYGNDVEDDSAAYARKVARWLSTTDVKQTHADTLAKRTPGTGLWLVEGDQFTLWSRGEKKVLWVTGMPGSGKTVLASIATDHIKRTICGPSEGQQVVIFFQCHYKISVSPAHILSTFLRQLLEENHKDVFAAIEPIYIEWQTKSTPLSEEQTVDILRKVFSLLQKVYIIVDALDELKESARNRLLRLLTSLPKGNLFLTSRPMDPDSNVLTHVFNREVDYLKIADKNRGDIATFVSTTLENNQLMASTESAKEDILTKMNQKSSGIFLLASLQVESLKQCISPNDLLKQIDQLPSGVTEMYTRTVEIIEAQGAAEASLARRALLWVTYAQTFLTLKRLRRALAISPEKGFTINDVSPERLILSCCRGLLVVDPSTRFARLVHATADDFIRNLCAQIFKTPHTFIAEHCIAYLSRAASAAPSPSSPTPPPKSFLLEPRPISVGDDDADWKSQDGQEIAFPYAFGDWGVHAKQAWSEPDSGIASIVADFLMGCEDYVCNISSASGWQSALRLQTEVIQPIHLVALHGLSKILPSMEGNWEQRTSSGSTPLHLASYKGHEDIVQRILKEAPSLVNDSDAFGYTPFMLACQQGHVDIVNLFLSHPNTVNLDARTRPRNSTPLILATIWGHAPVVRLLVRPSPEDGERLDVDLHAQDNQGQTALMIACALGFQEIVEILTKRSDLNVNQSTAFRYTAFTEAAIHGSIPIFELLLAHPLQAFNPMEDTALIRASRFGREAMVEYLLSLKNIDPNVRCGAGNTPLITAAADGHARICDLLLKHPDIDVNAQNGTTVAVRHRDINPRMNRTGTGTTALMAACAGGHKSVVDLLLRHKDINVDVKDNAGKTALLLARQEGGHGKGIVISLFLAMKSKPPGKIGKYRSSNGAVGGKGI